MNRLTTVFFLTFFPFFISGQCNHPDYAALISIYNALDGGNWVYNGGWVEGAAGSNCDVCSWDYVLCDDNDRVISFSSYSNGYNGTIPKEIGDLEFLEFINLSYGNITGEIPEELFQLTNLKSLKLTDVELTGNISNSIGNLEKLENLYLDNNSLTGEIPESIGNCTKLKKLFLNTNDLSGPIPSSINNFTSIEWIEFTSNELEGPLPDAYSEGLLGIKEFDVSYNQIKGSIPISYGDFNNLRYLGLSNNMLSDCIPNNLLNLCSFNVNIDNNDELEGTGDFSDFCSDGSGSCEPLSLSEIFSVPIIQNNVIQDYLFFNKDIIDELSIIVYDLNGELIVNGTIISENKVDLSKLKPGFYILRLDSNNKFIGTYKIYKY